MKIITKHLIKLRGRPKYQSINITEDLTWFNRKVIKKWASKTEERNARESNDLSIIWRVRGSRKKKKSLHLCHSTGKKFL